MGNKFFSLPKRSNTPRFKCSIRFVWLTAIFICLVFWIAVIVGVMHVYSLLMRV